MDSFVVDKLTQWQLTDLVDSFKDEGIDEESFVLLDEGTIKQLIPKAGPRLKFLKKFRGLVGTNLVEYLDEAKASRPYPYVLSLGNDIWHSSQAFLIVAGEALEQKTLLQAVDVCFKVFYIFDIEYPKQCAPVWEFLQNGVYGLEGDDSKPVKFLRAALLACK